METSLKHSHFRRAALCIAGLVLAVAVAAPSAPARGDGTHATVTRVTVKMYEYRFALSLRKVRAGTVIFSIVNKGQLAHDFAIEKLQKTSALIQPGGHAVLRVTFKKPGSYYYVCTVGAHVQYGMHGNLTVTK
jgi:plastocyanin